MHYSMDALVIIDFHRDVQEFKILYLFLYAFGSEHPWNSLIVNSSSPARSSQLLRFFGGPGFHGYLKWNPCTLQGALLKFSVLYHSGLSLYYAYLTLYYKMPSNILELRIQSTLYCSSPVILSTSSGISIQYSLCQPLRLVMLWIRCSCAMRSALNT